MDKKTWGWNAIYEKVCCMKNLPVNIKYSIIYSVGIGLICHLYILTNKFLNHDDLYDMISNFKNLISSGRWFLSYISQVSSYWSLPVINGILSILYIGVSAGIVVYILDIKSKIGIFLVSGIMITFPTVCCTFPFMHMADCYFFSLFLTILATAILIKTNKLTYFLLSIFCIAISLGIYQAYVCTGICFAYIYSFRESLCGKRGVYTNLKKLLYIALGYCMGLLLYRIILEFFLQYYNMELSSYRGIDKMWHISLTVFVKSVKEAYDNFIKFFFTSKISYNNIFRLLCNYISLFCLVYFLIRQIKERNKCAILSLVFLFFYPLALNFVYLMSAYSKPSTLMIYANTLFYILPIALIENKVAVQRLWRRGIHALMIILVWLNILLSNQAYLVMQIKTNATEQAVNRVWTRVESIPGYYEGIKCYFSNPFFRVNSNLDVDKYYEIRDLDGIFQKDHLFLDMYLIEYLKTNFLIDINYATQEEIDIVSMTDEFVTMKAYPDKDSIKIINDILVVKFN